MKTCHCGVTVNPFRNPGYYLSACDPCLEARCTEAECFLPEDLGEPLPMIDLEELSNQFDVILDRVAAR